MSGSSRAITLSLSVRDADVVRTQLLAMGEAGEQALTRLDAAAQRATGGGGALSQISTSTQAATRDFGGFRNAVQSGGYQLQDFAVQVQGGTSALTALSQQGGQFLGIFGPAGAAAGAALTIGLIAAQFLTASENAAEAERRADTAFRNMRTGAEDLAKVLREVNALFQTQGERATAAANETREAMATRLRAQLDTALQMQEDSAAQLTTAQAELARLQSGMGTAAQGRLLMQQAAEERARRLGQPAPEAPQIDVPNRELFGLQSRISNLQADISRSQTAMASAQEALNRLTDVTTANAPTGADRDAAEALRRSLDDRYRINQEYEEKVADLRRRAAQGLLPDGEIGRLEAQATQRRNEALQRLDRQPAGRAARPDRPGLDVDAVLAAGVRESTEAFNDFNEALNLNEAGISAAQGALSRYERDMQMLDTALTRGVITEEQFTVAVEASTLALGRQIEEVQRRGQNASTMGRELGMTFSSAFEDAILKGKEFKDVLQSIIQDLARIVLRQTITAPLSNAISRGVQNFDFSTLNPFSGGGAGITALPATGGISLNPFGFANGGIMTGSGPVPLRRYSGGGIATSPQLAMFGEGSTPEAYVPLPDGRRIPVAMQGGGAITFSPTINVDARGSDANTLARARIEAQAIAASTIAQFADSIQRGGSAAKIVGRR